MGSVKENFESLIYGYFLWPLGILIFEPGPLAPANSVTGMGIVPFSKYLVLVFQIILCNSFQNRCILKFTASFLQLLLI